MGAFRLIADRPSLYVPRAKRKMTSPDQMLSIQLNGEPRRVAPGTSIAALAAEIGLNPAKIAVERNLEIVPRSTLVDVMLEDGDSLEIVHFVGGG
jgi:thiazole synthase